MAATRPPLAAAVIATWFGLGYAPKAPGTFGTLGAVPLAWALGRLGPAAFLAGLAAVTAGGTLAAHAFGRASGREDDQRIVVDEVAGYLLTLAAVARTPLHLLLAFFLFRLFDIWKPQPVRWIDTHLHGGVGVMADDLAAGVYAGLFLTAFDRLDIASRLSAWLG